MPPSVTIVFFGSGPVAAATLTGLRAAGFHFEAIITKPRAEGFRGDVPVLALAQQWQVPYFTPTNKTELSTLFSHQRFTSRLGLVVDYGIIINQDVIDAFPLGIINSHFSLLPQWRGADPITFAILSGQQQTGVSLMVINQKLDEGQLISSQPFDLPPTITITTLTEALVHMSNQLLIRDIPRYIAGDIKPYNQPATTPSYSHKIKKEDGQLDWHQPADTLERQIRAYLGWPKSYGDIFGHHVIVTKARVAQNAEDGALVVPCNPGWLEIIELIAPSGRKTSGADFLRGYRR